MDKKRTFEEDEKIVTSDFWPKVRKIAGQVPFMDDLTAAYFCALDPQTPTKVRGVLMAALAYFVVPTDMIPDVLLGVGLTDDATVLATAIGIVSGHIKPTHREAAARLLMR